MNLLCSMTYLARMGRRTYHSKTFPSTFLWQYTVQLGQDYGSAKGDFILLIPSSDSRRACPPHRQLLWKAAQQRCGSCGWAAFQNGSRRAVHGPCTWYGVAARLDTVRVLGWWHGSSRLCSKLRKTSSPLEWVPPIMMETGNFGYTHPHLY